MTPIEKITFVLMLSIVLVATQTTERFGIGVMAFVASALVFLFLGRGKNDA